MNFGIDQNDPAAYESDEAKPMMHLATLPPAVSFHRPFPAIRPGLGVKNEVKKPAQIFKLDTVSVRPMGVDRWHVRYHDPRSGRDVRRRFTGLTEKEVLGIATTINHELLAYGGYLPRAQRPTAGGDSLRIGLTKKDPIFLTAHRDLDAQD